MPGCVQKALEKYQYTPWRKQDAPHKWTVPAYGAKTQFAKESCNEAVLAKQGMRYVQLVNSPFLYYASAVDHSMLPALNQNGTNQSAPTAPTKEKVEYLMDYAASHTDATIRYNASDMILHVDSDAAYLVMPKVRSRIACYYYLANCPQTKHAIPQ